jgi:hypothetical protein
MKGITKQKNIIERIVKQSGVAEIMEVLTTRLSLTDLQSLLLCVYKERAASLSAADVLKQYQNNRFVKSANIDPTETTRFNALAFAQLPQGFLPIELSPLCPLGTCSALGPVDQNNVVSTIRNTEVLADPTNVMALECALRRKNDKGQEVKLCCSQRLVRAQQFSGPATFAHFQMLSLCTSGRDPGGFAFEKEALVEHMDYYLRLFKAVSAEEYIVKKSRVKLMVLDKQLPEELTAKIKDEISKRHADVPCEIENAYAEPGGYYCHFRFQIFATNGKGEELFLVDGGPTDWMKKLLNNNKERFMTSGLGAERFLFCFRHK